MVSAGIKEFKNRLSYYLSYVKKGQDVLITDRGKIIARVIQENPEKKSLREIFDPLIRQGLIEYPVDPINREIPKPLKIKGKPVSQIVIEDRR